MTEGTFNVKIQSSTHHDLGVTRLPESGGNDSPLETQSIYISSGHIMLVLIYKYI